MDKSPDAFRTISEVADDLDLPQHVLRFWETRFGQIRPLKRGGGRRYYRPDDVELLRGIRTLLYGQGYTIRGVQRILKEKGIRYVQALGRGETVAPVPGPAESEAPPLPQLFAAEEPTSYGQSADEEEQAVFHPGEGEGVAHPLAREIAMRLSGVLAELMECRRLLAVVRGPAMGEGDGS